MVEIWIILLYIFLLYYNYCST